MTQNLYYSVVVTMHISISFPGIWQNLYKTFKIVSSLVTVFFSFLWIEMQSYSNSPRFACHISMCNAAKLISARETKKKNSGAISKERIFLSRTITTGPCSTMWQLRYQIAAACVSAGLAYFYTSCLIIETATGCFCQDCNDLNSWRASSNSPLRLDYSLGDYQFGR